MKSGNLNFLEPSGPLQACNGTAVSLHNLYMDDGDDDNTTTTNSNNNNNNNNKYMS